MYAVAHSPIIYVLRRFVLEADTQVDVGSVRLDFQQQRECEGHLELCEGTEE